VQVKLSISLLLVVVLQQQVEEAAAAPVVTDHQCRESLLVAVHQRKAFCHYLLVLTLSL
jgi:hypothetical protein